MKLSISEGVELKNMLKDFGIEIQQDVKLGRFNIGIDTELNFNDNFKYFLYMFELFMCSDEKEDIIYTINLDTLKNSSIKQVGELFQLIFYDKNNIRDLYNSRMEFIFSNIESTDINKYIDTIINLINVIEKNIELIDEYMSFRIIQLYDQEIEQKSVKSLSEFVRKYDRYIYTEGILRSLYGKMNLRGCCSEWLVNYRRKNKIELFTISDVKTYKDRCIKAIMTYKNN